MGETSGNGEPKVAENARQSKARHGNRKEQMVTRRQGIGDSEYTRGEEQAVPREDIPECSETRGLGQNSI